MKNLRELESSFLLVSWVASAEGKREERKEFECGINKCVRKNEMISNLGGMVLVHLCWKISRRVWEGGGRRLGEVREWLWLSDGLVLVRCN